MTLIDHIVVIVLKYIFAEKTITQIPTYDTRECFTNCCAWLWFFGNGPNNQIDLIKVRIDCLQSFQILYSIKK